MVAPTDYGVQIADPTQSFLSAFQAGAGIQEARLKQEQQTQQAAQQKLIQEGFTKLRSPNATTEDVSNLAMILPKDQSESVLKAWALKTDVQKQNSLSQAGKVVSALFAGENEIAQQYINDQAVAMRNSGNEEGAKFLETWRGVTEINPAASRDFFTSQLLQLPGGKEIVENVIKLGAEKRAAGKAPSELLESQSKAKKAEAEAKVAVETATDDIARAKALRELEQAKARKEKADADVAEATVQSRQDLATAQVKKEQALTAASVGGEDRAAGLAESVLGKSVADAAAAVADAQKKVDEAKDTPARLEAEQDLRVAQTEQQRALTAASVGGETRAAAKAPSELIEAKAKADRAVADAKTAQATATTAPEKAAADAKRATADAEKARIEAQFEEQKIKLGFRKTEQDIIIAKENARIAALNAAQAKETNVLRRAELKQKIDDAKEKRDAADRDQKATVANQTADIDNFLNTAQRILQTPKDVIVSATGPVASRLPTLSSDVADFEALVEALGSQAFIAQIPKIKGTGSLSEKEGDKLQASLQTLSLKQSPARLIENVTEAVRLLKKVRENISIKYGVPALPLDVPAAELSVTVSGTTYNFPTKAAADTFKSSDAYKRAAGIR